MGFGELPMLSIGKGFITSRELYFPSYVGRPGTPHPDGCKWVRRQIIQSIDPEGPSKRIYITRRLATKRRVLNEEELIPVLLNHGFEIVEAESLTFDEQVRLFSSAEMVVAPHGAGLANLLWVPAGCKVFEILDRDYVNDHFYNLSSVIGLNYYYMLCDSENALAGKPRNTGRDHMIVSKDNFENTIIAMTKQ
jgi:capsular polysaccharide biosynthesis protein